jgi:3-oxoacyl-[acyl-carrier-protein] synthase II
MTHASRELSTAERVVITGIGSVSPVGLTAATSFEALVAGRSGIDHLEFELPAGMRVRVGGKVRLPSGTTEGEPTSRLARLTRLAVRDALQDAALTRAGYEPERVATVVGVSMGSADLLPGWVTETPLAPELLPRRDLLHQLLGDQALDLVASEANARGPALCVSSACASSTHAIGEALDLIRSGVVDAAVTGGVEAALSPWGLAIFERIGALSTVDIEPSRASRPFDRARDGFVMSEGATIMTLERYSTALARGARIYAELAGFGCSADAFQITRPREDAQGMADAMRAALSDAGVDPSEVGHVNAHGTGTPYNDLAETKAIKDVFGGQAQRLLVNSVKSMVGHMLGAAGAFECMTTALTLRSGIVPPTINLDEPDEACDLDYVPHVARRVDLKWAISNSFGFGGQNGVLVLRRSN